MALLLYSYSFLIIARHSCQQRAHCPALSETRTWPMRSRNLEKACAVGSRRVTMTELRVGDPAPDFELTGSDGVTYRLRDFARKTTVVLAWFPKAFTGG